jgi:hypothetical protein
MRKSLSISVPGQDNSPKIPNSRLRKEPENSLPPLAPPFNAETRARKPRCGWKKAYS